MLAGASATAALVLTPAMAMFTALHGTIATDPGGAWYALLAVAVTVGVHLSSGRRTILSVGAGTVVYVVLLNAL
ncbi:hypothetical protein ABZ307_16420 [Streptomyces griseorubiginosus]|uniref:hypothetical protein n=1 Tax=Streptomyces griseorubiginosus TaxID=67304 RepID=UPI0033AD76E7